MLYDVARYTVCLYLQGYIPFEVKCIRIFEILIELLFYPPPPPPPPPQMSKFKSSFKRAKNVFCFHYPNSLLYRVSQKTPKTIENDVLLEFQCLALN